MAVMSVEYEAPFFGWSAPLPGGDRKKEAATPKKAPKKWMVMEPPERKHAVWHHGAEAGVTANLLSL